MSMTVILVLLLTYVSFSLLQCFFFLIVVKILYQIEVAFKQSTVQKSFRNKHCGQKYLTSFICVSAIKLRHMQVILQHFRKFSCAFIAAGKTLCKFNVGLNSSYQAWDEAKQQLYSLTRSVQSSFPELCLISQLNERP